MLPELQTGLSQRSQFYFNQEIKKKDNEIK